MTKLNALLIITTYSLMLKNISKFRKVLALTLLMPNPCKVKPKDKKI